MSRVCKDRLLNRAGRYIEPTLARKIAEGDACPISLLRMEDINPTFTPRVLKPKTLNGTSLPKLDASLKGKARMSGPEKSNTSNLLTFFTPRAKVGARRNNGSMSVVERETSQPPATVAGRSSGKRTLAELVDEDIAAKRKRREEREPRDVPTQRVQPGATSRYFADASIRTPTGGHVVDQQDISDEEPVAGPSQLDRHRFNKENVPCRVDSAIELLSDDSGEISLEEDEDDLVTQEDGYLSPSPSIRGWDSPEVSSPMRPGGRVSRHRRTFSDDDFGADVLSSPPSTARHVNYFARKAKSRTPSLSPSRGHVLVQGTPTPSKKFKAARRAQAAGPDLRDIFEDWDERTSEIDEDYEDSMESTPSSGVPETPDSSTQTPNVCVDDLSDELILDEEEIHEQAAVVREAKVANGWWERWARKDTAPAIKHSKLGTLRRSETTVTAEGHHRPTAPRRSCSKRKREESDLRSAGRESSKHVAAVNGGRSSGFFDDVNERPGSSSSGSERAAEAEGSTRLKLAQFRYITT
ncbi:hypothetical protein BDW22DRAFT_754748 [Trametopsis cervina]|nr:hypothetical protein BDW22DRAFT_754748 [Trametopsis cervina]